MLHFKDGRDITKVSIEELYGEQGRQAKALHDKINKFVEVYG